MSLSPGQIIDGKYRIVRELGVGGMGAVYEGENTRIHRRVAIKVLHAQVATKADIVQRFEREAQAAGRIGSEHIVEVLDLGVLPTQERYMVMEFLDGVSLTQRIKVRGRLAPQELAPLLVQLLEGLGAAHRAGIVHRDLKPDNIFIITRGGRDFVKLVDFGVSKFSSTDGEFSMTRTGAVMGTPYYMSPEQARGQPVDHRSDLYAIGVVAYQAVTGHVPFQAETFNELIFKIALETPPPLDSVIPGFDPGFAQIIQHAMARDPAHRFQSADEFASAVRPWAGMSAAAPSAQPSYPGAGPGAPGPGMHAFTPAGGVRATAASHPSLANLGPSQPGVAPHYMSGVQALGTSGLGTSGAQTLGSSVSSLGGHPGAGQLGQSQVALAVTTPQPKKSGPIIAAVAITAMLGVAGGVAAFKYARPATNGTIDATTLAAPPESGGSAASDLPTAVPSAASTPTSEPSADASAAPSAKATSEPSADASAAPSAKATSEPKLVSDTKATTKSTGTVKTTKTTKPTATATPVANPTSGRSIDGSL
jgi:eukaryotic-like serine/threonine-protein kinase